MSDKKSEINEWRMFEYLVTASIMNEIYYDAVIINDFACKGEELQKLHLDEINVILRASRRIISSFHKYVEKAEIVKNAESDNKKMMVTKMMTEMMTHFLTRIRLLNDSKISCNYRHSAFFVNKSNSDAVICRRFGSKKKEENKWLVQRNHPQNWKMGFGKTPKIIFIGQAT